MESQQRPMSAVYFTTDLIFQSRAQSAARAAGVDLVIAASPAALQESVAAAGVHLVILDLTTTGCDPAVLLPEIRRIASAARVLAYAPHVMKGRLTAAQQAGCDQVLTRGQFDARLLGLLQSSGEA